MRYAISLRKIGSMDQTHLLLKFRSAFRISTSLYCFAFVSKTGEKSKDDNMICDTIGPYIGGLDLREVVSHSIHLKTT